jgi:hypothetical protein
MYNPLGKVIERVKAFMKASEFRTGLLMVMIPLSFGLVLEATKIPSYSVVMFISGGVLFLSCLYLWDITWKQIKDEEKIRRANDNNLNTTVGKMLQEMIALNHNITTLASEIHMDREERKKKG